MDFLYIDGNTFNLYYCHNNGGGNFSNPFPIVTTAVLYGFECWPFQTLVPIHINPTRV